VTITDLFEKKGKSHDPRLCLEETIAAAGIHFTEEEMMTLERNFSHEKDQRGLVGSERVAIPSRLLERSGMICVPSA
jgi:hypothetical protein